ncbi:uncharacterized protein LAESUDRAFT_75148 [Laetiporus sulphureus 93-53]|uniref:Fungal-type protein kinase domain-containing protein n=1 Tax=Laetiporus sulphureus 93-53 TaxID=1314785 RepID=A0A165F048_9APHY|nr:uncharacterized protein LAESUDRAFT_75148 [Laetiporus sulphureus 93-53]KZT08090.1 hypothetical protein LAESUDRAFT_75148 [Laetiporus sulphureus 93-53]
MELCKEVDPLLGIINDEKWLSTYSSKADPSSSVRAEFPEFSNSKFNVTEENKMHAEFTRVAQEILDAGSAAGGSKNSVRTLVVKDTGNHPDIEERKKPDLTFYPNTPEARKAYELSEDELGDAKVTPEERRKFLGRAAWPHACVFVEFKAADHKNPFEKRKDEYMPRDTDDARNARGQMYEYATAIMNAQPRTHVFFISIWRTQATLFYADHSQFVCTMPFTFTGKSSALSTFLYHLGQMTSEELGYDSSVTLATVEELAAVKDVEDQMTPYHQKCVTSAFFSESGWPVYKVIMPAEQAGFKQSKEDGAFLIGRPLYKIYSPTGRATKVYAAYNMKTERMVTVKDCWPEEWEEGEHTKYECIEKAGVQYTATCLYGGYVGEQKTKTCDDLKHTHPVRRHYRIALKELGRPLYSYDSSGELIVAGWCVLTAHRDAWIKCGLLQRDMSPGNMIFDEVDPRDIKDGETPEFRALLIDFHLAKFKHELQDGAKRVGRSGTWQFISARLLRNPTAQNEVADDLESVILIMEWMALRFHEHQYILLDQLDWLKAHVETFFDFRGRDPDERHVGGAAKYRQWMSGKRDWELSYSGTMPVPVHNIQLSKLN